MDEAEMQELAAAAAPSKRDLNGDADATSERKKKKNSGPNPHRSDVGKSRQKKPGNVRSRPLSSKRPTDENGGMFPTPAHILYCYFHS